MDLEKMKQKYAYTLAKVGLNVQPGQPVLVEAAVEGCDFVPYFKEACYKLGASNVIVHYLDIASMKTDALYRTDEQVREFVLHRKEEVTRHGIGNLLVSHFCATKNFVSHFCRFLRNKRFCVADMRNKKSSHVRSTDALP